FLKRHKGAIRPNLIQVSNTGNFSVYQQFCNDRNIGLHPARMPAKVAEIFIQFLTKKNDLVLDPFSGSNTTGVIADRLKRRWISIEARPDYAASGVSWFSVDRAETLRRKHRHTKSKCPR